MARRDFEIDLLAAITDPLQRAKLIAILERWRGVPIYLRARKKNARRQQAARNMVINGMESADIAAALRERFSITDRTARRDVASAKAALVPNVKKSCPSALLQCELPHSPERTTP
jgi:hypothetical protein